MTDYGLTIKKCAHTFMTSPKIVKDINKERLEKLCGDMKPRHISRHLAVDEFLIEHGHRYCTIIIDADTGELLYLEKGKKSEQLKHFFEWAGPEFMSHVEAISMDMNTNYSSAVKEIYPNIAITYDSFHIIQWFNKGVIDSIRKAASKSLLKQADKLTKKGNLEEAEYLLGERKLLFGNRFTLLANQKTLEAKDKLNKELNKAAKEEAKLNGRDSSEVGKRREDNAESRAKLLGTSESIATCIKAREELQDILKCDCESLMRDRLKEWSALYSKAGIMQLTKFISTIENRFEGIVSKARFHISSGILEGTNAFIKNLRRSSFGLVDFDYLAYLIWERTHGPNKRRTGSHGKGKTPNKYTRQVRRNMKILKATVYNWKGEMAKRETA
jgi:transposase